ncbi:MAG: hypothetical protein AMQ22_00241 [Candidatus Methanofastidiosum methylothiophilum]|uniref:HK97 gp10 family phage protein n=1 Tax=Candidatus Methanofastidiosum methylothiophilum TaxID=1705564 RepID=A0A150IS22_9EURY|nr:MAG: hypothetical protein APG11_00804 [Candidatus Methanofastidiosum methylthiophilus]KYC53570.1 MAG: hypothetical protein AMQ22_00241 [Candidatus Methanofastidiosum methylthiophilus]
MKTKIEIESKKFEKWVNNYLKSVQRDKIPDALRHITIDLIVKIIEKNPVDTGRSRAGWYIYLDKKGVPHTVSGKDAKAITEGKSKGSFSENFDIYKPFIEIRNGVIYVKYLEYGSSKRSPLGMVRLSMAELSGKLSKEVLDKLTKESISLNR